jgi:hypothetical protein
MGAGVVGPSVHDVNDENGERRREDAHSSSADEAAAALRRTTKEERPRISRDTWQSLTAYLGSGSPAVRKTNDTVQRSYSEASNKPVVEGFAIRGAARQARDSAAQTPSPTPTPSSVSANIRSAENTPADRTATGTPATQARTPEANDATAAIPRLPARDIMARTRARLAQLKQELPGSTSAHTSFAHSESIDEPENSGTSSARADPRDTGTEHASPPSARSPAPEPSALLRTPVATVAARTPEPTPESPHADNTAAAADLRARLLARLAHAKRAEHHHEDDAGSRRRHGDDAARAAGPRPRAALGRATPAARRRDAELLETTLRRHARERVASAPTPAPPGAPAGGETKKDPVVVDDVDVSPAELRTREEALRARLKRSR